MAGGRLSRIRFTETVAEIARRRPHAIADEIMRRFGGRRVPLPRSEEQAARDRRIREAIDSGEPVVRVAARERMSIRQVMRVAKFAEL